MRKFIVILVVAVVGVGLPAVTAGATSRTVSISSCGQVITTDAVLRTDLMCSGDGIVINGSDLTVQLGNHSISSTGGTGFGIRFGQADFDEDCGSNVSIRGGTVSGFAGGVGVACNQGTGDGVSGTRLIGNMWGVASGGGISFGVDHATIVGPNGVGPRICCGSPQSGIHLSHSTIQVTSPTGLAWFLALGPPGSIESSRIEGGEIEPAINSGLDISNSRLTGVTVWCSDASLTVEKSTLVSSPVVEPSACQENFNSDRFVGPGSGVGLWLASNFENDPASVTNSVFTGWGTAIEVYGPGAVVTDNTFRDNGTGLDQDESIDGSCTAPFCVSNATGNRFVDNSGPGLSVTEGFWRIGENVAMHNGGLGIDAEGPQVTVIDDGGNIARHNAPPQCIGVVCTP